LSSTPCSRMALAGISLLQGVSFFSVLMTDAALPLTNLTFMGCGSTLVANGTYNGCRLPVCVMSILQETPRLGQQTSLSSSHEGTAGARAPMQQRRLQHRCTASLPKMTTPVDPLRRGESERPPVVYQAAIVCPPPPMVRGALTSDCSGRCSPVMQQRLKKKEARDL
jgi:hypothetical protein